MFPKRLLKTSVRIVAMLTAVAAVVGLPGCAHAINPFADEAAPLEEMTTTSERVARDAEATPIIRRREWPQTETDYPSGRVIHWPLWFEDPFEDKGSEDGKFAWTAEDYIAMPYSVGRLLLNTVGWPVSAVVTPPGTPMVSDGRLSRQALGKDHDATRLGKEPDRTPLDEEDTETSPEDSGQLADDADQSEQQDDPEGPPFVEQAKFDQ